MTPTAESAPSTPALRLVTLGGAELVAPNHGASSVLFGPGKPVALLAYLAASPGRTARRDHLIDLLWADMDPDAGRHALRQLIWYVRQRAGDLLESTRDAVALRAPLPNDRDELLAAVERQDCDAVVALYLGDFLPNIALPGGGEFEQWADLERQRLRSAYLRCGDAVARRMLSSARHREAIALARRLLQHDPHSEHVWRLLIESQLSAGDLLGAASEADSLSRFLEAERREPEPATRALLRRASSLPQEGPAAASHAIATEMIGRAEEFKRLIAAWDDARAGRFRHVHVVAPSGIGKSRILSDFAARLRARGARVVTIRLRPGDRALPQSAAADIAAAVSTLPGAAAISSGAAGALVALHPPLSSQYSAAPDMAHGDEGVRRRTVALQELIAAVADEAPTCIIVDDLHWMDDVSRRMLTSVLQRLDGQRVLAVSSSRPRYPGVASAATHELTLYPLSAAQTGALLASLGSLPVADWAQRFPDLLHSSTGGSPLLTLETLQLLLERELLSLSNGAWTTSDVRSLEDALGAGSALVARIARLGNRERSTLLDLAAAGVPLTDDFIAHASSAGRSVADRDLAALEQRGLIQRLPEGWTLAHDAIGEASLASAPAEAIRAAHRRLGIAWLEAAGADVESIRRAASQFVAAGEAAMVRDVFVRWLRILRHRGDDRPLRTLAEDFASPEGTPAALELAASVPLSLRISRRATYTAVAVAATALVGIGFTALRPDTSSRPEAVLTAMVAGERDGFLLEIESNDFAGARPLELARLLRVARPPSSSNTARLSPDGRFWAVDTVFADSGGQEVALIDSRTGTLRRLTRSRGDDNSPSWSPDGMQLVYSSSGQHPRHHNKLMALDVATGRARQLTFGEHTDVVPAWHPSGTYVAFSRRHWTDRPDDLCLVSVRGRMLDCIVLPGKYFTGVVGWYDAQRVVVRGTLEDGSAGRMSLVNVTTREVLPLGDMHVESAFMSADGQWLACRCRPSGAPAQPLRWQVFPTPRPDLARQVLYDLVDERPVSLVWTSIHPSSRMVVGVAIDAPRVIPANAPAQLRAAGIEVSGQRASNLPMRWESLDATIASIDSITGILTPHRPGSARVRVDVGGWRSAETNIAVVTPEARTTLLESWDGNLEARFVHVGDPKPVAVRVRGIGPALAMNGDSSYTSGIYSREPVDGTRGVGADLVISARIDQSQWQNLSVNIMALTDDSALARWDHTHGGLPISSSRSAPECYFTMPLSEGPRALRGFSVLNTHVSRTLPLAADMRSGLPFRLRVQLFPDGACGFAIDGKAVAWIPGRKPGGEQYSLVAHGYSSGTTIATGPIEIWTGVKPDMDWRTVR